LLEKLFEPRKRVVERLHEKPAHQIDDEDVFAADGV